MTNLTFKKNIDDLKPMIHIINDDQVMDEGDDDDCDDDDMRDWSMPGIACTEPTLASAKYGFNNAYSSYEAHIHALAHDVLDIDHIDASTIESRRAYRLSIELQSFNPDHYMFDFMSPDQSSAIMEYKPEYHRLLKRSQINLDNNDLLAFTQTEQSAMLSLQNRDFIISDKRVIYLGLIDLLFAYSYDLRINTGEHGVESAWTICKLSPTLAAFDSFTDMKSVAVASYRFRLSLLMI